MRCLLKACSPRLPSIWILQCNAFLTRRASWLTHTARTCHPLNSQVVAANFDGLQQSWISTIPWLDMDTISGPQVWYTGIYMCIITVGRHVMYRYYLPVLS